MVFVRTASCVLAASLVLGAITSVCVCLGFSMGVEPLRNSSHRAASCAIGEFSRVSRDDEFGRTSYVFIGRLACADPPPRSPTAREPVPAWLLTWFGRIEKDERLRPEPLIEICCFGWPSRCAYWEWGFTNRNQGGDRYRGAILLGNSGKYGRIPASPIWPGLLLDTAFYGAVWLILLFIPGSRRRLRRRRGHCPRCGYDLKHDLASGCPECGWNRAVQPSPVLPVS